MEPIINPCLIYLAYLAGVAEYAKGISLVILIASLVGAIPFVIIAIEVSEDGGKLWEIDLRYKIGAAALAVCILFSIAGLVLIPDRETVLAMTFASALTENNINAGGVETAKTAVDYIVQQIQSLK